jgi:hypothetical protein
MTNLVLSESRERVFAGEIGVEELPLGVYIVKGDNVLRGARTGFLSFFGFYNFFFFFFFFFFC